MIFRVLALFMIAQGDIEGNQQAWPKKETLQLWLLDLFCVSNFNVFGIKRINYDSKTGLALKINLFFFRKAWQLKIVILHIFI